jgi:Protein of unknown function (DUF4089)
MMEDANLVHAVASLARLSGLQPDEAELALIADQLRLAAEMAAKVVDFPLPDEAEPAPVFTP